jgi:hypothetical protein
MSNLQDPELTGWFSGRLPEWFVRPAEITVDRDEILVVGELSDIEIGKDATEDALASARGARIERFREETRDQRIRIAREAEHRFGKAVSWGGECGDVRRLFTTLSVPVMTRLRIAERTVLDTLVDSGVARSRSDALNWCVRLVGKNQGEWIASLRDALVEVEKVRSEGPS